MPKSQPSYVYAFERLDVWQEARQFSISIYELTARFPADERFGLTSQIRRATVSIASNIAEGSARTSPRDQAHFYQLAYSSTMEVLNQLIIAADLHFLSTEALAICREKIVSITAKLNALRNRVLETIIQPSQPLNPSTSQQS